MDFKQVFNQLIVPLKDGHLDSLVGLKEDLFFEAKGKSAYDLSRERDRFELAKDVSSFANAEGGCIIIGLKTEILLKEKTEQVKELDLFDSASINPAQYEGVIREYVYPMIKDLQVTWIQSSSQAGLGIFLITVPFQNANLKPFVITKVFEGGTRIQEILVGIAKRVGSSSEPLTPKQTQDYLRKGSNSLSDRLTEIDEKLEVLMEKFQRPAQGTPRSEILARIKGIYDA